MSSNEHYSQNRGIITIEEDLPMNAFEGILGIKVQSDRVWICLDGRCIIRCNKVMINYTDNRIKLG